MKNKIVIDCTVLAQGVKTGVYRVAHELFCCLADADEIELIATVTKEEFFNGHGVDLRAGLANYLAETNIDVRFIDSRIDPAFVGADFFITPFFAVPVNWAEDSRVQKVVIAYDLIAINNPEFFEKNIINLVNEFYQQIQSDWLVLAISESTKRDLLKHRPDLSAEKIVVTYLGADAGYNANINHEHIAEIRAKYRVPSDAPYLLSVATLEIRKNLETAVSSFAAYIRQSGDQKAMLVLAGMKGWKLELLESEIDKRSELVGRVILTGFVDEADLPALYAGASGFVYLSRYEGFGLPPLEAMSCGVPVITSNTTSIPEVVGDAGIMLAPGDEAGVANAYDQLLNKPALRQHYSRLALQQAAHFSWTQFGRDVLTAISDFKATSSPYLSIITICYNEPNIKDTCESIHQQSFDGFEWIVIDGKSNDGTCEILEQYIDEMAYFVSEPDNGRYDAMNKGIAVARGKYLLFLNGGDYLCNKDTLATAFNYSVPAGMMGLFQWLPKEGIIYGEVIAKETGMMPYPMWRTGEQVHDIGFFAGASLPHQATFIQRSLFEKFGVYNTKLQYAADYEWFIRAIVFNKVATQYMPLPVAVYNFEGVSSSSVAAEAPHIIEIQAIYHHYSNPVNNIVYSGMKRLSSYLADTVEKSTVITQCRYADLDYGRSLLDMVLPYLNDNEINQVLANIKEVRSNNSVLCQQIFLKQIRTEKLPLATLITYVLRLARQYQSQSTALGRIPYERVLLYAEERLLQRIEWFDSDSILAIAEKPANDDDPISRAYLKTLGRLPGPSEVELWQNYLAEGHSLEEFTTLVEQSEEACLYARNLQNTKEFSLAIDPNNPPPIMANQYVMAQKALRRIARKHKFNVLIAAGGNS